MYVCIRGLLGAFVDSEDKGHLEVPQITTAQVFPPRRFCLGGGGPLLAVLDEASRGSSWRYVLISADARQAPLSHIPYCFELASLCKTFQKF